MGEPLNVVNAEGLKCPEPVMLLHSAVRDATPGGCIQLTATDPSTQKDIAEFCEFLGHELVSLQQEGDIYTFMVKKRGG